MRIETRWIGVTGSPAVTGEAERRIGTALGRFADRLRRVRVSLGDDNGPRGGVDKHCRVEVFGHFGSRLAEAQGSDYLGAVNVAADRIARAVARALEQGRRRDAGRIRMHTRGAL